MNITQKETLKENPRHSHGLPELTAYILKVSFTLFQRKKV